MPANKKRQYLSRENFEKGLCNIEFRSELMLLELNNTLERSSQISIRRAAMLMVEKDNQTNSALIHKYLLVKYKSTEKFTKELLSEAQTKTLMVDNKNKESHQRLFKVCEYELADVKQSAIRPTNGNTKPRDEPSYITRYKYILWASSCMTA